MQFTSFTKTVTNNTILFKNNIPIEYVSSLNYYTESVTGSFSKKEFRWSFNNNYWSAWANLNQQNFSNVKITSRYLFLEIRYTMSSINSGTVTNFVVIIIR